MKNPEVSREELLALVWERPATEVAKDIGISDVALGKLCRRLQVPKPAREYWARVEAGQCIKKPALAAFRGELENLQNIPISFCNKPLPGHQQCD